MGSFDREADRILHGQWQIKVYWLHVHAGTHILSLEISNKLLVLENLFLFGVNFLHFPTQRYDSLNAVLSYVFCISC